MPTANNRLQRVCLPGCFGLTPERLRKFRKQFPLPPFKLRSVPKRDRRNTYELIVPLSTETQQPQKVYIKAKSKCKARGKLKRLLKLDRLPEGIKTRIVSKG